MSIKWKIIIPVTCILVVLVVATLVFSSLRFSTYTDILFRERISVATNGLKKHMVDRERDSLIAAITASTEASVITAVANRDREEIIRILSSSMDLYHVDFITVTDADGIVLARTHEHDIYGDSIADQTSIQEALRGTVFSCIEEGIVVKVSARASAPVYDTNETLIGVISAGVRFDSDETFDWLKEHYHADFGVFVNQVMVSGTVKANGERLIGRPLPAFVAEKIYATKQAVIGYDTVNGENYSISFLPLFDIHGEIFAIIATGCSNAELLAEKNAMQANIFVIGLTGLAGSVLVLLFITARITKPIAYLSQFVGNVSAGYLENGNTSANMATKDEIELLTSNIYSLVDIIKSILSDLTYLTSDLDKFSDVDIYVDDSKYSGSYKEIIQSIKKLAESVSIMRKTMAVMDHLDIMISVADFNYRLLYVNRSMAEYYNMDRNDYIGKTCYKAIRNIDQPCKICQMDKLMLAKELYPYYDYDGMLDEESCRYIGGRAAIIRWVDNSYVFFNAIKDETVRIENQEKLRQATTAAEVASVAKTMFLANMSHEIRTPMNSIIGFTELGLETAVNPIAKEYLAMIKENAGLLLQIINDILDISKVESGNMEIEAIPFALHELLNSCKTMITLKASEKNLDIHFYTAPSLSKMLLGDPTKLRQVLINLLSNAIKFTEAGSVSLAVMVIKETANQVTLRFEVRDTGIGMTSEQITRIFEPFIQADISTTRKYGGTGLGMSITKSILDLMGSSLEVESEAGVGTVIGFELSLATTEKTPEMLKTGNLVNELSKPVFEGDVLICEDNQMNQRVIIDHLNSVGLKSEIAENGQEGIDKVQARIDMGAKPFDLIFMDIHMPVMDGLTAAPRIIEMGTGTPLVTMTANVMADDRELYKAAGMLDYLSKPFTSQELWRCLLKYLTPVNFVNVKEYENKNTDTDIQRQLKADFVTSNRDKLSEIMSALDTSDIKLAHRLVHTLKSNAGLIGQVVLQKAAATVEVALKGGENRVTPEEMHALGIALGSALEELNPYLNEIKSLAPADTMVDLDANTVRQLLEALEPLLKSGNPESLKMMGDIRSITGSGELLRQMEDYDFDAAGKELAKMKVNMAIPQ
ncbi:MAG: ATP-binding protein [Symbiobacteriaceae bacterium]|nr:ATP-binding protein [Symbiobacteriaceae bacterium]